MLISGPQKFLLLTWAVIIFLGAPSFAAEFSVLWPPDKFLTAAPSVRLIVDTTVGSKADSLRLTFKGTATTISFKDKTFADTFMGYVHRILYLNKGENAVKLEALAGGKVLEEKTLRLVFKNIRQKDVTVPEGFANKSFHIPTQESACDTCHQLQPKATDEAPSPASASTCYVCHSDKSKVLYLHGPVGAFQCLSCHNPQDPQKKHKLIARDAELCYLCHDNKEKEFKKKFLHGPLGTGRCELCHDPHGSDYPFWLFDKINEVCYNCHGRGYDRHPIAGHPTANVRDPLRKGKTLACTSCHDPHASDNRRFLLASTYMGTCTKCHRM